MIGGYKLTNSIPKEIGTSSNGSYCFTIAKYRKINATTTIMKFPGFKNANPVWFAKLVMVLIT